MAGKRGRPPSKAQIWLSNLPSEGIDACIIFPFPNKRIGLGGAAVTIRHAVCALFKGTKKPEQVAISTCKTHGCVNPAHVKWGSVGEAMQARGAFKRRGQQALTDEEVYQIRSVNWGNNYHRIDAARALGVSPKYLTKLIFGEARASAGFPPGWKNRAQARIAAVEEQTAAYERIMDSMRKQAGRLQGKESIK